MSSFGLPLQMGGVQQCGIVILPKHCRHSPESTVTETQVQRETWVRQRSGISDFCMGSPWFESRLARQFFLKHIVTQSVQADTMRSAFCMNSVQ